MSLLSSQGYIKRPYRVRKDNGAAEYFAALVVKKLVKHAWPCEYRMMPCLTAFRIHYKMKGNEPGEDFWFAVRTALRIMAAAHGVECRVSEPVPDLVQMSAAYFVNERGEIKQYG